MKGVGLNEDDDSFEEAIKAVNTSLTRTSIPDEVKAILEDPKVAKPEVVLLFLTVFYF